MKRGLDARSCARSGRKDVVGEVKGIEMMGVLVAGRPLLATLFAGHQERVRRI